MDKLFLRNRPVEVTGHVILDYTRNGKILERIEGDNMCFEVPFNHCANWFNEIETAAQLLLYNSTKQPDPELPYQRRANVIGWGIKDAVASGTTQGAYNASKSYQNKIINNGDGVSFKWAYDFGVTQMVGLPIKSLGIGHGYRTFYLNRYERSNFNLSSFTAKGYMGYQLNFSGTNRLIQVRSLKQQLVFNDIDVSAFVKTDNVEGDNWCFGFATDNNKAYILLYNGNAAQINTRRLLYEFADDTFSVLLNTYNVTKSTITDARDTKGFAVYKNKIYFPNDYVTEYDFIADTDPVKYPTPVSPIAINLYTPGEVGGQRARNGITFKDKYLFRFRLEQFVPIFNMETKQYEPECAYGMYVNGNHNFAYYMEPILPGTPFVQTSGNNDLAYATLPMLTCYTLPADAPDRPEDSGVSVDYQIDINYI